MNTTTSAHTSREPHAKPCQLDAATARALEPGERAGILEWLDLALRGGEEGRLEAEFPISLARSNTGGHRVVFERGEPVAHAMFHVVEARVSERSLPIGLIGLVYTAPSRRNRGLARVCVESCLAELQQRQIPLAALWTDRHALYTGIGFLPTGREDHYSIDVEICRRARMRSECAGREPPLEVDLVQARDWPVLEGLYDRKSSRAVRRPGALEQLAAAPDTRLAVARRGGRAIAYAAVGRGLDFPGVIHEWAGSASGVLASLEALCSVLGPLGFRCGPVEEPPVGLLREAGARVQPGCFALTKVLDPVGLWERVVGSELEDSGLRMEGGPLQCCLRAGAGRLPMRPDEGSALFFGPIGPKRVESFLRPAERKALSAVFPLPIYLWGFDSI